MAEITIQDVAQYLAEHGYATWSELTTRKMLTEDGMWTRLQSNYDSSRAIDPRYITFPTVDLSKYAKEADIKQWVKEQGYATTVPSLSGYATQSWVQEQGFLTQHQSLSDYATQQWVTARIQSSVSGFASQAWVGQTFLQLSGGTMTGGIESQNIIPVTDNTYSLGTSAKRWSIIRTMKADFAGEIYTHGKIYAYGNIQPMPNSNNVYPQLGTSAARWANVLTSGVNSAGHIIPSTTETYQLGTSQYRWNNVVTKSINATGTSSLAALSVSGSATFNNGINVATGSLTIGSCTISWDSSVGMLRFSTGIYSDGAVTAGGVGASGGGGGGGLSWENLASTVAAAGEQVNICHLTEALAGYATTSMLGGYALTSQLPTKLSDLTDDLGSSPTHTHSQYLTALPSHNHDSRYYISGGTVHLGNGSITPLTSHQSLAGYATTLQLAGYLPLSGGTLTGDIDSQNIIPAADNTYSLGTKTKRWSIIRSMRASFTNEIYTHGNIYAYGDIQPIPNDNNAYPQLGTRQYRWNNVVTKSIDATGTSSLAALSVTGSATFNNGINVAKGSLTIGSCTISWDSDVSMLRFSTGIYSDGAVTAGGVGSSGGGGGGGLTWDNLDAATTEQIALSHLTTALSGYLTSYGNRPSIGVAGSSITWIPENYGVILPLTSVGAGNYQLDLSGYAKTSDLSSYVTTGTEQTISEKKTFSKGIVAKGVTHPTYNSSDYLLHGGGGVIHISALRDNMSAATTNGNNTFTGSNTFKTSIELRDNAGIDFYDGIDTWNFFIDFSHDSRGSFCWCTAGQDIAWLDCDGVFHASGYQNSSDLRRKTLFGDVGLSVADIAAMPAVRFRWNSGRDTQTMHVGTIAQAWQTLLPEVVLEGSDGLLSMDYASAALVSAIVTARAVTDHERRILDLEKRLNIKD